MRSTSVWFIGISMWIRFLQWGSIHGSCQKACEIALLMVS
ncbi:Protein of unknown function [Pyronema omphalodes CBS 100304]|uniref:Uncharacterized protein n=1 Tax=Pyronema omphalodes (strain CBS 100304) TaxID=1076935 RepID=U4LN10_PYROM|nr:Protein of unknown function [Pyronema omphalodes CBS 100304]